ncbi:MAG: spirocyclase AveC family protein [Acidimicrobiia bacterium]
MTQLLARPTTVEPEAPRRPSTRTTVAWALLGCGLFLAIVAAAHNLRHGAVADRIKNPGVTGAPRPVSPLFGDPNWIPKMEIGTVVMMVILVVVFAVLWRRHPRHPYLLMTLAVTAIVWLDPIMNWAPYAVYNPQLWHWPETWPLVSLSPTVEPLIVVGYATFYFGPFFVAIWALRHWQQRRAVDSFVWRHPLISLAGLILVIGFVFDAMLEIFLVRTQLYIYSHVMPFGSIFVGKPYQFPLLWESVGVTLVMIPAGVLVYRDDTGRSVAEKLAQQTRILRERPALATFLVMFAILNVAYLGYGLMFATIRWTRAATSVACPWPYPEAKVYDPQGFYEKAGQPGPYFPGIWSGWESAQSGRPDVSAPANGGRCAPTHR